MSADDLPDDLRALEERLLRRGPALPQGLRARVLAAVQAEQRAPLRVPFSRLGWIAAAAAAIVLVCNLALGVRPLTGFQPRAAVDAAVIAQAEQLRELAPDLTPAEARQYVLMRQTGMAPTAPPLPAPIHPGPARSFDF